MRISNKNGLVKGLITAILVVLVAALTLTGCSDKVAQEAAKEAGAAAEQAQKSADDANSAAIAAQNKADEAKNEADANKTAIEALPDDAAVAEAIKKVLNDYVKGETITEGSIITEADLEDFLSSDKVASLLSKYALLSTLDGYVKTADIAALNTAIQGIDGKITAAVNAAKLELVGQVATMAATYLTKADAEGKYLTKEAFETTKTQLTATLTGALTTQLEAAKTECKKYTDTQLGNAIANYFTKTETQDWVTGFVNEALAGYDIDAALEAALKNYDDKAAVKAAIDSALANYDDKAAVKAAIDGAIDAALADYDDKAAVKAAIDTALENYYTKEQVAEFVANADLVSAYLDVNGFDTFGDLIDDLRATAQKLADDYNDATDYIVANYNVLDGVRADVEAAKANLTPDDYAALVAAIEEAQIRFVRAISVEQATAIIDEVKNMYTDTKSVAEQLAAALAAVTKPIIIPVEGIDDEYVSDDEIKACEDLVAIAKAQGVENTIVAYGELNENLEAKTADLRAVYALLEAAKANVAPVLAAIDAIPAFEDITIDQTANRAALKAAYDDLMTAVYPEWVRLYFVDAVAPADTADYFACDENNVNIERLIGADNLAKIGAAAAKMAALNLIEEEALTLNDSIVTFLKSEGYLTGEAAPYTEGTLLYTRLDSITTFKATIDEFITANGITEKTVQFVNYNYLANAFAYVTDMKAKYDEANADEGIIAIINAIGDAKLIAYGDTAKADEIAAAITAFNAWVNDDADVMKFAASIDNANLEAIVGIVKTALEACKARLEVLADAKIAADKINAKITAYAGKVTVNSMDDLDAISAEITAWYTDYAIVSATDDDYFVEANYNLIDHVGLAALVDECEGIIVAAVEDAKINFIPKVELINKDNPYILYEGAAIKAAYAAYYEWIGKWGITKVDLNEFNFGDLSVDLTGLVVDQFLILVNSNTKYEAALAAAKQDYTDNGAAYAAVAALADGYKPTVYDGINKNVTATAAKAKAFYDTYIDPALGFNDAIKAIEGILTETEYNNIIAVNTAYTALVAEVKAGAEAIEDDYKVAAFMLDLYDGAAIYDVEDTIDAFVKQYLEIVSEAPVFTDIDPDLAFIATLYADIKQAVADYEQLVADAKKDFADPDDLAALIAALKVEDVTIYSADEIAALREKFNTWGFKYLRPANCIGETIIPECFDRIADETIKGYKSVLEALVALEAEYKTLNENKVAETEAVQALIDALDDAANITNADFAAIEEARAAYEQWLAGEYEGSEDANVIKKYKIDDADTTYTIDLTKLTAAEAKVTAIKDALKAAQDAIKALKDADIETKGKTDYVALITEAENKIAALEEINGGDDGDMLTDDELAVIPAAKIIVKQYDAKVAMNGALDAYKDKYKDDANIAALEAAWATALDEAVVAVGNASDDAVIATIIENYNSQLKTIAIDKAEVNLEGTPA